MSVTVDVVGGLTAEVEFVVTSSTAVEVVGVDTTTTVAVVGGVPGPAGPPGETGPPGPAGTSAGHTHVQSVPDDVWLITHPLGYQPNVTVIDSGSEQVEGDVIYGPVGTLSVVFSAAFAGTAYLS